MFRVSVGEYEVCCQPDGLPDMLSDYQQRATLSEAFGVADETGASVCFVSVGRSLKWPFLVVIQRYSPAGIGFVPGVLLVPESGRLFIGAGRRLLAYDLARPARLWEDEADCGFWSWSQQGQVVVMSAELELAAWNIEGSKLWSRFVEPPWDYTVDGEVVVLDVMGDVSRIKLLSGDPAEQSAAADRPRECRFCGVRRPSPREQAAELWCSAKEGQIRDAGFELLRDSPVTRFADPAVMAEEAGDLQADGYRCVMLDCSAWASEDDFHATIADALDFPDYYGCNLDAFNDCLKSMKLAECRGLVLVFSHWEMFARVGGERAWAILDIIACTSRFRLVYGDRLLALLHVADTQLQFKLLGRVGVVPSRREGRLRF